MEKMEISLLTPLLIFNPSHCLICLHRQPKMAFNKDAALAPQWDFTGDLN
jgi:hypothetical protein